MPVLPLEPWRWSDSSGSARLVRELETRGIARIRMPDFAEQSHDPRALFVRLFGANRQLYRVERSDVKPTGGVAIHSSNDEGPLHVDDDDLLPADVQLLGCLRPAARGGESIYVDAWDVLSRIEREDRELFRSLFEIPRVFLYTSGPIVGPTFSTRYGRLVCHHSPDLLAGDEVGARFQAWLERSDRYEFRARLGDVCITDHLRMLHGRRAFRGKRHVVNINCWSDPGLPSHRSYLLRAQRFARKLNRYNSDGPDWAREWLQPEDLSGEGLARLAAVLAYLNGARVEDVAARLRVEPNNIMRWATRVLAAGAATLRPDRNEASRARVLNRHVLGVIDALASGRPRARRRQRAAR